MAALSAPTGAPMSAAVKVVPLHRDRLENAIAAAWTDGVNAQSATEKRAAFRAMARLISKRSPARIRAMERARGLAIDSFLAQERP